MATGKTSELVRGAGMYLNFLNVLNEAIVAVGGHPEMLYFAQREHARPLMKQVAELIVKSGLWRIPRSWIEDQVAKGCTPEQIPGDIRFGWSGASTLISDLEEYNFAINEDEGGWEATCPIPAEIIDQLTSAKAKYPYVVKFKGTDYVVTHMENDWSSDKPNKPITGIRHVELAPAKYFDLEN